MQTIPELYFLSIIDNATRLSLVVIFFGSDFCLGHKIAPVQFFLQNQTEPNGTRRLPSGGERDRNFPFPEKYLTINSKHYIKKYSGLTRMNFSLVHVTENLFETNTDFAVPPKFGPSAYPSET